MGFAEFMMSQDDEPEQPKISRIGEIECLKDALAALNTKHEFHVGMIVRQKPACLLYKELSDNHIGIVVGFCEPYTTPDSAERAGGPHWREPKDMIVGIRIDGGSFALCHVDSRRYEPAPLD